MVSVGLEEEVTDKTPILGDDGRTVDVIVAVIVTAAVITVVVVVTSAGIEKLTKPAVDSVAPATNAVDEKTSRVERVCRGLLVGARVDVLEVVMGGLSSGAIPANVMATSWGGRKSCRRSRQRLRRHDGDQDSGEDVRDHNGRTNVCGETTTLDGKGTSVADDAEGPTAAPDVGTAVVVDDEEDIPWDVSKANPVVEVTTGIAVVEEVARPPTSSLVSQSSSSEPKRVAVVVEVDGEGVRRFEDDVEGAGIVDVKGGILRPDESSTPSPWVGKEVCPEGNQLGKLNQRSQAPSSPLPEVGTPGPVVSKV